MRAIIKKYCETTVNLIVLDGQNGAKCNHPPDFIGNEVEGW